MGPVTSFDGTGTCEIGKICPNSGHPIGLRTGSMLKGLAIDKENIWNSIDLVFDIEFGRFDRL